MKNIKMNLVNWMMSLVVVASVGGSVLAIFTPQTSIAAGIPDTCNINEGFLGFPSWYRGLVYTKNTAPKPEQICDIKSPKNSGGLSKFIWLVVLNVVEMAIVAAAYLSGFMFIYGGWMFIISQGKPESAAKARSIMTMAAMGLVLMISAVALVNFVFDKVIK